MANKYKHAHQAGTKQRWARPTSQSATRIRDQRKTGPQLNELIAVQNLDNLTENFAQMQYLERSFFEQLQ